MGVYLPNYEKPKGCFFKNTRCIFNDGLVCKLTGTRHNTPERLNCVLNNCPFEELDLVRCGECKWWDKDGESPYGYCHAEKHCHFSSNWEISIYRKYKADHFCSDGERRE